MNLAPILSTNNLGFSYPRESTQILKNISFEVCPGDILGIVGRNGAGKSTLLRLIGGVYPPKYGDISIKGTTHLLSAGSGINPNHSGRDATIFKLLLNGIDLKEARYMSDKIKEISGLGESFEKVVHSYSSGMHARLQFYSSILSTAEILLIDELTSVGDIQFREHSQQYLRNIYRQKKAVLIVSHNLDELAHVCNRVIWIEEGTIIASGNPNNILKAYHRGAN